MILKDDNHKITWKELRIKTHELIEAGEELDPDKIQIGLKALLPRYAPRSFIYVSKDDEFKTYDIKGQA